jgi:hypothetical protein
LEDGTVDSVAEKHEADKLTPADEEAIRGFYASGKISMAALAEVYGVSVRTICRIVEARA